MWGEFFWIAALLVAGTSLVEWLGYRTVRPLDPEHVEHGEAVVPNFTEAPGAKHHSSAHTDLQLPIKAASGAATAFCA